MEQYLQIYGNTHQNDWPTLLPLAQFVHNTWPNATMKQMPYDLLLGFTPQIQVHKQNSEVPELGQRKEWLEWAQVKAMAAMQGAQELWKKKMKRKKGAHHYQGFKQGNQVWLEGTNLKSTHPCVKLAAW